VATPTNDELAAASAREAVTLGQTIRDGSTAQITQAFEDAARRPARSIEKSYKPTTLIAVFIVDYTNIILRRLTDDKKKHFASLVFGDEQTLQEIHKIGSLSHIAAQLQPFSDLSEEEVAALVKRIK
jgi:hypothetical protein